MRDEFLMIQTILCARQWWKMPINLRKVTSYNQTNEISKLSCDALIHFVSPSNVSHISWFSRKLSNQPNKSFKHALSTKISGWLDLQHNPFQSQFQVCCLYTLTVCPFIFSNHSSFFSFHYFTIYIYYSRILTFLFITCGQWLQM